MENENTSSESLPSDELRPIVERMRRAAWAEAQVNRAILEHFRSIQLVLRDRVQRCDKMLSMLDALSVPPAGTEVEESEIPW